MDVEKAKEETEGSSVATRMPSGQSAARARLVVALVAQSALVLLCLALSFHSWVTARSLVKDKDKWQQQSDTGVYLDWKVDNVQSLKFRTHWVQNMKVKNESEIMFPCSGPYLMYLSYSFNGEDEQTGNGTLRLLLKDKSLITFQIKSSGQQENATILTFNKNDVVSVSSIGQLSELEYLHLSFYYMLGTQCFD